METGNYRNSSESEGYKPIDPISAQTQTNANRNQSADELIQKLYKKRIPEPTFDQDKADRLQRMGRINQAGRGIAVLGDILATGLGAPVRRRQPDSTAPALYQSYQANLDKYKYEKDQNLLRDYDKDRQDLLFGIGRADRDDELEFRNRRQTAAERLAELRAKAGLSQKERELAERERHNKEMEKASAIRANKTGARKGATTNKPFNPVEVKDENGKLLKMSEGEWSEIYSEALGNSPLAQEYRNGNLKTLKAMYETQSSASKKEIAREFYLYKQQKEISNKQDSTVNDSHNKTFSLPGLGKNSRSTTQSQTAPANQSSSKKVPSFFLNGKPVTKPIF